MNHVDFTEQPQKIISFCTGLRGIERGLERAGVNVEPICYVEIEAFICENLVSEMQQGSLAETPIWTDLKTFDARPFRGKVHGFIGGYPCQPFSNAGARNGTSDPRHLYPFISKHIEAARPLWCFFENVEGHLTLGFPEVSADLRSMGYAVEAGIFSAEEVGATHQRNRLFILAIKVEYLEHARSSNERNLCGGFGEKPEKEPIPANTGNNVVDASIIRCHNEQERCEQTENNRLRELPLGQWAGDNEQRRVINSSDDVGNTTSEGQQKCGFGNIGELSEEERIGVHNRLEQSSITETKLADTGLFRQEERQQQAAGIEQYGEKELADTSSEGCERSEWDGTLWQDGQAALRPITEHCNDRWPARPGEQQYNWERPRTISRLGCTVDGYNYREDLIRAFGNSVVEQTAAVAWINLLMKHGL